MSRLAVVIAVLAIPASIVTAQDDQFAPIAGNWDHHGFFITVDEDGGSRATWRVYRWCDQGNSQPCDQIINNAIVSGGHAVIRFTGSDGTRAFQGEVLETTDPEGLDLGPLTLKPQPFDMALLEQGDFQLMMCGEQAATLAPAEVLDQCGA